MALIRKKLYILTYIIGRSKWATSDKYLEWTVTVITDLTPMYYIANCKELFWDNGWEKVYGWHFVSEVPENTIFDSDLEKWDGFPRFKHFHEDAKKG